MQPRRTAGHRKIRGPCPGVGCHISLDFIAEDSPPLPGNDKVNSHDVHHPGDECVRDGQSDYDRERCPEERKKRRRKAADDKARHPDEKELSIVSPVKTGSAIWTRQATPLADAPTAPGEEAVAASGTAFRLLLGFHRIESLTISISGGSQPPLGNECRPSRAAGSRPLNAVVGCRLQTSSCMQSSVMMVLVTSMASLRL